MSYHPRIERADMCSFLTTRTRSSRLWFINNKALDEAILGYAAKYQQRYNVKLYALAIEGNHIQIPALFPDCNRAHFMRDFNACVARAVPRHVATHEGGGLWARRYSAEFVPGDADIEEQFFYTVLQAVQDGLVDKISQYPGYNCFHDAIWGIKRKVTVVNWAAYNAARRWNVQVKVKDYVEEFYLSYERLPGYEKLSQKEYAMLMMEKLEAARLRVLETRKKEGHAEPAGPEALKRLKPGARPWKTKTSGRFTHRPRVLSISPKRYAETTEWYFETYKEYHRASAKFRAGDFTVAFPRGSYRPHTAVAPASDG
jgi:hypothetical protein